MTLAIVTATLDVERARACISSWAARGEEPPMLYIVRQAAGAEMERDLLDRWIKIDTHAWGYPTATILGVVPAFAIGVQKALDDGYDVIACFHDDLLIEHPGWEQLVLDVFQKEPTVGLVGFGGGKGLGDADIYRKAYDPMQLARKDFISNMRDAEAHGRRVTTCEPVACLDGFSQIGRKEFWTGQRIAPPPDPTRRGDWILGTDEHYPNLFGQMHSLGVIHHFYDGMLGCFAARLGWDVWMLPVRCHHFGGRTAVADPRYHAWANATSVRRGGIYADHMPFHDGSGKDPSGDQRFWADAHWIGFNYFRDVLPIRR